MQFLSTLTITMSAMLSLAAAGPLTAREVDHCPTGYVSCGKDNTDGGPGFRCAAQCTNLSPSSSLGRCTDSCLAGYYPDECINGGDFDERTKCSEINFLESKLQHYHFIAEFSY
ncbi:hypothetical protein CSHISOI_11676, partial [Colletotrichum shisoi]